VEDEAEHRAWSAKWERYYDRLYVVVQALIFSIAPLSLASAYWCWPSWVLWAPLSLSAVLWPAWRWVAHHRFSREHQRMDKLLEELRAMSRGADRQ
jgi:hypothetical protein